MKRIGLVVVYLVVAFMPQPAASAQNYTFTRLAGDRGPGYCDGPRLDAAFGGIYSLAVDDAGSLIVGAATRHDRRGGFLLVVADGAATERLERRALVLCRRQPPVHTGPARDVGLRADRRSRRSEEHHSRDHDAESPW